MCTISGEEAVGTGIRRVVLGAAADVIGGISGLGVHAVSLNNDVAREEGHFSLILHSTEVFVVQRIDLDGGDGLRRGAKSGELHVLNDSLLVAVPVARILQLSGRDHDCLPNLPVYNVLDEYPRVADISSHGKTCPSGSVLCAVQIDGSFDVYSFHPWISRESLCGARAVEGNGDLMSQTTRLRACKQRPTHIEPSSIKGDVGVTEDEGGPHRDGDCSEDDAGVNAAGGDKDLGVGGDGHSLAVGWNLTKPLIHQEKLAPSLPLLSTTLLPLSLSCFFGLHTFPPQVAGSCQFFSPLCR